MSIPLSDIPDEGRRDCGTFFLDVVGAFQRQDVTVCWSDQPRAKNDQVDRLIDQAWEVALWQAKKAGQNLFDGDLCRLIDYVANGRRLELTLGKVTYKEFVGTNQTQACLRYLHGPEVLADPLGVSAALRTGDGLVLLGRRSDRAVQYGRRIHPIGGSVEPVPCRGPNQESQDPAVPDPFQTVLRELSEETGVSAECVQDSTLLGLVRDKHTVQPELIFEVRVAADADEICRGAAAADDAEEHTELVPVRDHPAAVITFIEQNFNDLTPVALATLLLHGLYHWGSGWFANTRGHLRSVI